VTETVIVCEISAGHGYNLSVTVDINGKVEVTDGAFSFIGIFILLNEK
jgi:hypothetical protein